MTLPRKPFLQTPKGIAICVAGSVSFASLGVFAFRAYKGWWLKSSPSPTDPETPDFPKPLVVSDADKLAILAEVPKRLDPVDRTPEKVRPPLKRIPRTSKT